MVILVDKGVDISDTGSCSSLGSCLGIVDSKEFVKVNGICGCCSAPKAYIVLPVGASEPEKLLTPRVVVVALAAEPVVLLAELGTFNTSFSGLCSGLCSGASSS